MAVLDQLEAEFSNIVRDRVASDPDQALVINKDSQFTENPSERDNLEEKIPVSEVKSMQEVYQSLKKKGAKEIGLVRVPVKEENAPGEDCIDILVDSLKLEPASTQCVFSCQAGQGRTSLGQSQSAQSDSELNCLSHCRDDHRLPGQGDPDLHGAQEDGRDGADTHGKPPPVSDLI